MKFLDDLSISELERNIALNSGYFVDCDKKKAYIRIGPGEDNWISGYATLLEMKLWVRLLYELNEKEKINVNEKS